MTAAQASVRLQQLLEAVRDARSEHETMRARGVQRVYELEARREMLVALEEFVAALKQHGLPVPPRIRDELRLCRAILGPGAPRD